MPFSSHRFCLLCVYHHALLLLSPPPFSLTTHATRTLAFSFTLPRKYHFMAFLLLSGTHTHTHNLHPPHDYHRMQHSSSTPSFPAPSNPPPSPTAPSPPPPPPSPTTSSVPWPSPPLSTSAQGKSYLFFHIVRVLLLSSPSPPPLLPPLLPSHSLPPSPSTLPSSLPIDTPFPSCLLPRSSPPPLSTSVGICSTPFLTETPHALF